MKRSVYVHDPACPVQNHEACAVIARAQDGSATNANVMFKIHAYVIRVVRNARCLQMSREEARVRGESLMPKTMLPARCRGIVRDSVTKRHGENVLNQQETARLRNRVLNQRKPEPKTQTWRAQRASAVAAARRTLVCRALAFARKSGRKKENVVQRERTATRSANRSSTVRFNRRRQRSVTERYEPFKNRWQEVKRQRDVQETAFAEVVARPSV